MHPQFESGRHASPSPALPEPRPYRARNAAGPRPSLPVQFGQSRQVDCAFSQDPVHAAQSQAGLDHPRLSDGPENLYPRPSRTPPAIVPSRLSHCGMPDLVNRQNYLVPDEPDRSTIASNRVRRLSAQNPTSLTAMEHNAISGTEIEFPTNITGQRDLMLARNGRTRHPLHSPNT